MQRRLKYRIGLAQTATYFAFCIGCLPVGVAAQEKPIAPLIEIMSRPPKQVQAPPKPVQPQLKPLQQPTAQKGLPALETLSPTVTSDQPKQQTDTEKISSPAAQNSVQPPEQQKRKITTLREQMQTVESLQNEQLTSTEDLRKEIREVKRSVDDLRRTVEESIVGTRKKSTVKSVAKAQPDDMNDAVGDIKPTRPVKRTGITDENIILPDGGKKTVGQPKTTPVRTPAAEPKSGLQEDKTAAKPVTTSASPVTSSGQPEQPAANGYREAMNLIAKKKYSDAVPLLQQTLQTEKSAETQSSCYYWLGESFYGLGKYDDAIKHFQKVSVLRSSTKLDDAQIMIAESYYRKGDLAEAKVAFRRLIDVFPKSEYVARAKKMLQEL